MLTLKPGAVTRTQGGNHQGGVKAGGETGYKELL